VGFSILPVAGDAHRLTFAETMVVPAAVGGYTIRRRGSARVQVVKAVVR
jgi:hypothetical protein